MVPLTQRPGGLQAPVEILILFGPQGERIHVRAKSRGRSGRG
ncbi:hypothetical protein [Gandjariella thermophila]|nr:hypothetical protein [Gandjariella thermophila]